MSVLIAAAELVGVGITLLMVAVVGEVLAAAVVGEVLMVGVVGEVLAAAAAGEVLLAGRDVAGGFGLSSFGFRVSR